MNLQRNLDMKLNEMRFHELSTAEAWSTSKRVHAGAWAGGRIQSLSLALESLWMFYEAMRSGKPLASGDERLTLIKAALKSSPKKM